MGGDKEEREEKKGLTFSPWKVTPGVPTRSGPEKRLPLLANFSDISS